MQKDSVYAFNKTVKRLKLTLEWRQLKRPVVFSVFSYDYKARLINITRSETVQESIGDSDNNNEKLFRISSGERSQYLYVDFARCRDTTSFLITIDGFESFHNDDDILFDCSNNTDYSDFATFFQLQTRMYARYQGLFLCIFYIDGFHVDSKSRWIARCTEEPMLAYSISEQESFCNKRVVSIVPSFERFRFHLFSNIRGLCAALSSQSLPKLKDKFSKYTEGVNRECFTELIFNKLYESHPKIIDPDESIYSVALIRELFNMIDFSGDELVSWEEFTTFVIQTIVMIQSDTIVNDAVIDEYTVEYEEDVAERDRTLSPHIPVLLMRYVPETKLLLVVPVDSDVIFIFNSRSYNLRSKIDPSLLVAGGHLSAGEEPRPDAKAGQTKIRTLIYDAIYLSGKDFYAFSADDYSITICKEVVALGGKRVTYNRVHRILHTLNHPQLCWSIASQIMCSISTTNTLFGWDLKEGVPKYQSNRHTEVISSVISVEILNAFATCSMDKSIILHSSATGRVKGVMRGHTRGVKCIAANSFYLISGGFDCEAKVWALDSKAVIVRLQGHRAAVVQAKLMCDRAQTGKDYRAITVDENGEFRLWDISVSSRFVEPPIRTALQVFEMTSPQTPMSKIKYIALGYDPIQKVSSYFATIFAIGSKLMKFKPKKNQRDFLSVSACLYNEPFGIILVASGRDITGYEISTGRMASLMKDISSSDITCMCFASEQSKGKTFFIGNSHGEVISVNFRAGVAIHTLQLCDHEINCLSYISSVTNFVVAGDAEGSLNLLKDNIGHLSTSLGKSSSVFGNNVAISKLCVVTAVQTILCCSKTNMWCLWDPHQSTPLAHGEEATNIAALEVIGTTISEYTDNEEGNRLITFAVALNSSIMIYTIDLLSLQCICSFVLEPDVAVYLTNFSILRKGPSDANYIAPYPADLIFLATSDDGQIVTWDCDSIVERSEATYKEYSSLAHGFFHSKYKSHRLSLISHRSQTASPIYCANQWKGHSESIMVITTLDYYGCFFTAGNDGYGRVWSLAQECIGEFKLPNITDEMKDFKMKLVSNGLWNLILETKTFDHEEVETAKRLVEAIINRQELPYPTDEEGTDVKSKLLVDPSLDLVSNLQSLSSIDSSVALVRSNQLRSLKESAKEVTWEDSLIVPSVESVKSLISKSSAFGFITSTSVADLSFGYQKSFYKNAEELVNSSKRISSIHVKHMLEMHRIDRKIKSTSRLLNSLTQSQAETIDTSMAFMDNQSIADVLQKEEMQSQNRIYKSSLLVPVNVLSRPLDKVYLNARSDELQEKLAKELKKDDSRAQQIQKQKIRKKMQNSYEERAALEKKLMGSILFVVSGPKEKHNVARKKLRAIDILPSYTFQEVNDFIALFNSVDFDYSGSLDIREWIRLLTSSSSLEANQAISMFDGAETKSGGKLYVSDLVPMIFPKANKRQRKLITEYAEAEIFAAKSISVKEKNKEPLKVYDMERLFECYDAKSHGFISLKLIRERINQLQLPISALVEVTQDLYGDDYVSIDEFLKIFRNYIDDIKL